MNRSADTILLSDPGAFLQSLLDETNLLGRFQNWFDLNRQRRGQWVEQTIADIPDLVDTGGKIHPLNLALDVQQALDEQDWLVIDGGNTHFWSEIAVNVAGYQGQKLGNILHPGTFSMLGVGVSFAITAKMHRPDSQVVLISGDGAFLSGGLSVEAAFQENLPIVGDHR